MESAKASGVSSPRFAVVGPGALGTYFAARLGLTFPNVWVLDHDASRAQDLSRKGFHVRGATSLDWQPLPGRVAASPKGWPVMDWVIFLVKAGALKEAAASVGAAARKTTKFLCLQNGWGAEHAVEARWGKKSVVTGVTHEGVTLEGVGRVFHAGVGATLLDARAGKADEAARWLSRAGFLARVEKDFEKERRLKLVINASINPVGALAAVPNGRLREAPLWPLLERAAREATALSGFAGKPLAWKDVETRLKDTLVQSAENRNSMSQDVARGAVTEREFLLGPLLAAAKRKKISAPTLSGLDGLLRALERR